MLLLSVLSPGEGGIIYQFRRSVEPFALVITSNSVCGFSNQEENSIELLTSHKKDNFSTASFGLSKRGLQLA